MAQTLTIGRCTEGKGRCTNLNLSSKGGSLLRYMDRAAVGANRRSFPPKNQAVRSNLSPSHEETLTAGQGWPTTLIPAFADSGSVHLRTAIESRLLFLLRLHQ